MGRGYRSLEQWNHWLGTFPGTEVLAAGKKIVHAHTGSLQARRSLLIGVPQQRGLLSIIEGSLKLLVSPLPVKTRRARLIQSDLPELPIASASMDLVILPHTLEYVPHPRHLLAEACRTVRPEGHIVVTGFNPCSLWGLHRRTRAHHGAPWKSAFLSRSKVRQWLRLADFTMSLEDWFLYRPPPMGSGSFFRRLDFLEWLGRRLYRPFGGAWILIARAHLVPLTPIRLQWKQKIANFQPGYLAGPVTRLPVRETER